MINWNVKLYSRVIYAVKMILFVFCLSVSGLSSSSKQVLSAPSAWTLAQADFYGDPTSGPNVGGAGDRGIEAVWGSGRVLGPISYLIGNGLPTPIFDFNASNLNSWRAQEDGPGANSSFITGNRLRLYSPPGSSAYRASACFGGCDGDTQSPGVPIATATGSPDIFIKWDIAASTFPVGSVRNFILTRFQTGIFYAGVRHIIGAGSNTLAFIWNTGSGEQVGLTSAACSTAFPSTPYGIGVRLRIGSYGLNAQWLCGQYIDTDYLSPNGATNVIDLGNFSGWGSGPYQLKIGNRTETATSASILEIQYIRNVAPNSPTSAIGNYDSNVIDSGKPSSLWQSVTCHGVTNYGGGSNIYVRYKVWNSGSEPAGWSAIVGDCRSAGTVGLPPGVYGRFARFRLEFSPVGPSGEKGGYSTISGASVQYAVDNAPPTAPTLTLGGFAGNPPWNPTTLAISGSSDSESGLAGHKCNINNAGFGPIGSCPSDVSSYSHGTTIVARAVDNAENESANSDPVTIQRDTQAPNAPSVTLGGFTGVPPWNPTTVSYAHNGDNGPSGVNRIECSINGGAFSSPTEINWG